MSGDPNLAAVSSLLRSRYRVIRRLPWNGLALVYLAERRAASIEGASEGRRVAVALLPLDCERSPALIPVFGAEAARLRRIDDPHVVPVTDAGVVDGVPFLELRYENAPTLAEVLASPDGGGATHLEPERALELTRQILRGLTALHAKGVSHWDLTPSNVLLAIDVHGWEQVRLVGAGIGTLIRTVEEDATAGRARRGSGAAAARYLAPELLTGGTADRRADVYSAGAILLHLLAGTLPAEGTAPQAALPAGSPLAPVLQCAMAAAPEDRYPSARGMLAAIADPTGEAHDEQSQPTLQLSAVGKAGSLAPTSTARRSSHAPAGDRGTPRWGWVGAAAAVLLGMAAAAGVVVARSGASDRAAATAAPAAVATEQAAAPAATAPPAPLIERAAAELPADAPTDVDPPEAEPAGDASEPDAAPVEPDASPVVSDLVFDLEETAPGEADDPLAGALPDELGRFHPRIDAGEDLTRDEITEIYGYLARNPDDVRGHLVLGHAFMNLGWRGDALERYRVAGRVDASAARHDPKLLPDLMELLSYDDHHVQAALAIREIFGADALPLVRTAYETEPRWEIRRRLQRLERRLTPDAEPATAAE